MNSAVRRFTLFFFSLATLASCEDPSDLGLDLQDENLIGTHYTDTLTINSGTVANTDSILAFRKIPLPLGGYQDGVLGNVKATVFTEVGLSGLDVKFGENPVADSLVLTLDYTTYIYGSDDDDLTLNIHRLTQGFQDKASYFTNSSLAYANSPLATVTFDPELLDTTENNVNDYFVEPVRVKLDLALANEILAQSGQPALKDQFKFVEFLKGLAIVPQNTPREMIAFNPSSPKTRLTLYYKNDTTRKEHIFSMSGSNVRNFSKIEANRAGTVLESAGKYQLIPSSTTGGESYVQSGTELYTKLSIPHLDKLKEKYGNIVINRAELVIPVKNGSNNTLKPPSSLAMYFANGNRVKEDANGSGLLVPKDLAYAIGSNSYPAQLAYNSKTNQYTANITAYVQAMVLGKVQNSDILLAPALFQSVGTTGALSVSRDIFPYRTILSNTAERGMKLRIYYSKLD